MNPDAARRSRRAGKDRILDRDAISGAQLLAKDTIDRVQRAAGDDYVVDADPVGGKLRLRERDEGAHFRHRHESVERSDQCSAARGEQLGIGIAAQKIDHTLRNEATLPGGPLLYIAPKTYPEHESPAGDPRSATRGSVDGDRLP